MDGPLYLPNDALGITEEQAQERVARAKEQWEHYTPEFVGIQAQSLDMTELERQIKATQRVYEKARIGQSEATVVFRTTSPITVYTIGDVHYGSVYCDHERFESDIARIIATPNCYAVFMSNMIDNAIPSQYPDGLLVAATPPDKQAIAMRKIAMRLNETGRLLGAVTSPCHEGWTYKHTGQDINALIYGFPERRFPVLDNGGRLTLRVGTVEYLAVVLHQLGPYNSNFNHTHGTKQQQRLVINGEADIVAAGHHHVGDVEMTYDGTGEHRKIVAYLRTGCYKGVSRIHDQWSVGRYGSTGEPSGQAVTLWPNERRMQTYLEFDTAVACHEALSLLHLTR